MFCREVLGADRVMYAMDYPYEYTPGEVTAQDALPVDAAARKAFFQGIAEQVFGADVNRSAGPGRYPTGGVPWVWKDSMVFSPHAWPLARSASVQVIVRQSGASTRRATGLHSSIRFPPGS
jgi:hypothetical protein